MGAILNKSAYEWETTVTSFDVDLYSRLKISSILKLQQEIGELHLTEFGATTETLRDELDMAFFFLKISVLIHRFPVMEERLKLTTWCSWCKGVRFLRNYRIESDRGLLTESKAEVSAIGLTDRRIVRPRNTPAFDVFVYNTELENACPDPSKLVFPETPDEVISRKIRFSDIDYNGHVNNTVYADMMMDCLPREMTAKAPKLFTIQYQNEVKLGETLHISKAEQDGEILFSGASGGQNNFIAALTY